jgi:hypothetical protein
LTGLVERPKRAGGISASRNFILLVRHRYWFGSISDSETDPSPDAHSERILRKAAGFF